MITQRDIAEMSEAELAALAANAPAGMVPVFHPDGSFSFISERVLDRMSPSERLRITVVGRAH